MSKNDLLVMVPTRGRRAQCERLLGSFRETASESTGIVFILDPDDGETYDGMDWGDALVATLEPRAYLTGKLNKTAMAVVDAYDALAWAGDDHVFRTPGWDKLMLAALKDMGGSGWVYPDDKRRNDVPEIWMCSSDVVKTLGYFANPQLSHYFIDNSVAELGKRSGLIRWCPEAVVEHLHYQVAPSQPRDEVYASTEEKFGKSDMAAFRQWQSERLPVEVALLRREYCPDVSWVLEKVGLDRVLVLSVPALDLQDQLSPVDALLPVQEFRPPPPAAGINRAPGRLVDRRRDSEPVALG